MHTTELIDIFKENLNNEGMLLDLISRSENLLHARDILSITELLSSSAYLLIDLLEKGVSNIDDFQFPSSLPLHDQVYIKKSADKTIVYVFNYIEKNALTNRFKQCLGTLNSPNVFGKNSNMNIQGLLLNIFEIHNSKRFIFPSWCNIFLIDGQFSRGIPNVCLSSIEPELSNPIDFYPDALKTLKDLYGIHLKNVDITPQDVFVKAEK